MYYGRVQELAQGVLTYVRRHGLIKAGNRVGVAVSGGMDSVALLRLLIELRRELGVVLSVVHFNHKLRGAEADADERFVLELAQRHKLQVHCDAADVRAYAGEKHLSVEAAGRKLRYEYFARLLLRGGLNRIATAHTLDDQAETVLLRIVRGAGSRGLAGVYPHLSLAGAQSSDNASIVRPLLGTRRKQLELYLAGLGQEWREDESNRDLRYARNRVRHGVLPRLERNLNPQVCEALAETAEIARAEEEYWTGEIARVLPQVWATAGTMNLAVLSSLPLALRRRVIRAAAESLGLRLEFQQVEEILELSDSKGSRSAALPGGWAVSRRGNELQFKLFDTAAKVKPTDYEYSVSVPGQIQVPETGTRFEVLLIPAHPEPGYNPDHLFDPELLATELRVRNWRPGDRFWPAHTKCPKKIKELLQERHVTGAERQFWPVVESGSEVVWLRGFPGPTQLRPRDGAKEAVVIRELPLHDGSAIA